MGAMLVFWGDEIVLTPLGGVYKMRMKFIYKMALIKKDKLLNQLLAQLLAIKKMQDEGRKCRDILIQVKAAKSLMRRFVANLMKEHFERCIQKGAKNSDEELNKLVTELVNYS